MAGLLPDELGDIPESNRVVTSPIDALQSTGFTQPEPSAHQLAVEMSPANQAAMQAAEGQTVTVPGFEDTRDLPALPEVAPVVEPVATAGAEPAAVVVEDTQEPLELPEPTNPMDTAFNRNDDVPQGNLQELREQPGIIVRAGAAIEAFSPTKAVYDSAVGTVFEADPEFRVSNYEDQIKAEFPPALWHSFMDATSEQHLQHMFQKSRDESMAIATVFDGGTGVGLALTAAVILADPTSLVAGVAEYKALAALGQVSRLQRAATGGVAGATTGAAQEGVLAIDQQNIEADDVVVGAALGFGLGSALGAIWKSGDDLARAKQLGDEIAEQRATGHGPDPGDDAPASSVGDSVGARAADTDETPLQMSSSEMNYLDEAEEWEKLNGAKLQEQLDTKTGKAINRMNKTGFGLDSSTLLTSKSAVTKWFGATFLENGAGLGGRTKTAAVLKDRYQHQMLSMIQPELRASYKEWANAQGVNWYKNPSYWGKTKDDFNLKVREELEGRRMKNSDEPIGQDASVNRAAAAWQKGKDFELEIQQKHGVTGADEIERLPGYVPLKWSGEKLRKLKSTDRKQYESLLSKQYMHHLGVDAELSRKMAGSVIQRAMRKELQLDTNPAALVSADARGQLREMLEEGGIKGDDLENLLHTIDAKRTERGKVGALRRRNDVDLFANAGGLRLVDVVDNNLDTIAARGAGESSGRAAMAAKGVKNTADWESLRGMMIKDEAIKNPTINIADFEERLDGIYAQMHSRPVGKGINRHSRRLTDLAGVAMLGQVGFAQTAEISVMVSEAGVKEVIREMPILRSLQRGKPIDPHVMRELEDMLGDIGSDHLLYRPEFRFDSDAVGSDGRMFDKIDQGLAAGQQMLGYASGMNFIKGAEQRLAVRIMTSKVARLAKGETVNNMKASRLADLGWDEKAMQKITTQMNKHAEWDGDTLKAINLEKWDIETMDNFAEGINRFGATTVQKAMVGQSGTWMHSTMGSILTQFRSFPIIAMERQLARNTLHNDMQTYTTAMWGLGVAAAVSMVKTTVNAPGLTKEQFDHRMSAPYIAQAAVQYTGMAGLLPDMFSIGAVLTGNPDFAYGGGRTGTLNPGLNAIPAAGAALNVLNTMSAPAKLLNPNYDFSRSDVTSWQGAVPLGNSVPMAVGFGLLKQAAD